MGELDSFFNDINFDAENGYLPIGVENLSSGSVSNTDNDPDGKKQKQLERNRETAKRCRKRKRERIESLMDEVARLRETNRELEVQLKICQSKLGKTSTGRGNRGVEEEKRRIDEMNRISQMVSQNCSEKEIMIRLRSHQEVYSDFGEERQKVLSTHLKQLESLLMPSKISKMLLWLLEQDKNFYTSTDGSSIWNTLKSDMKITDSQISDFMEQRNKLGRQNTGIRQVFVKLKKLEDEIMESMKKRREQMKDMTSVFTPTQQAKFLSWVENNEACVHLLDNLWKQRTTTLEDEVKSLPSNSNSTN